MVREPEERGRRSRSARPSARPHNPFASDFVHAIGSDLLAQVEEHANPAYVDHLLITMDAGIGTRVTVSVNTLSRRNRDAGYDARVRVGWLRGSWNYLPPRGVEACQGFDYDERELGANIYFEHYEREALEKLLLDTVARSDWLEVWGEPYHRRRVPGIHQIHSRRASCAVAADIRHRDGALQFYFADQTTELFLFKFCGQP